MNNRVIKFRAWAMDVMLYSGIDFNYVPTDGFQLQTSDGGFSSNYDLMQYTGLKDKNGVEIYEGDIVLINHCDYPNEKSTCFVSFLDYMYPAFDIYHADNHMKCGYRPYCEEWNSFSCPDYLIEVIGNIHENPELMETK